LSKQIKRTLNKLKQNKGGKKFQFDFNYPIKIANTKTACQASNSQLTLGLAKLAKMSRATFLAQGVF
jgi:hypothetical protein